MLCLLRTDLVVIDVHIPRALTVFAAAVTGLGHNRVVIVGDDVVVHGHVGRCQVDAYAVRVVRVNVRWLGPASTVG